MNKNILKILVPKIGKFSDGEFDVVGISWFGIIIGKCVESRWNSVMNVGDWVYTKRNLL